MKINFLGDSITQGAYATSPEKIYTALVCKAFGAKEENYGIGGTRIADQKNKKEPFDYDRFLDRAVKMDIEPKSIVFENDIQQESVPVYSISHRVKISAVDAIAAVLAPR